MLRAAAIKTANELRCVAPLKCGGGSSITLEQNVPMVVGTEYIFSLGSKVTEDPECAQGCSSAFRIISGNVLVVTE